MVRDSNFLPTLSNRVKAFREGAQECRMVVGSIVGVLLHRHGLHRFLQNFVNVGCSSQTQYNAQGLMVLAQVTRSCDWLLST